MILYGETRNRDMVNMQYKKQTRNNMTTSIGQRVTSNGLAGALWASTLDIRFLP